MATALTAKFAAGVARALAKLGRDTVFITYPSAAEDDVAGTTALGSPTPVTVRTSPPVKYARRLVDNDLIQDDDCYIIAGKLPTSVNVEDEHVRVQFSVGDKWRIVDSTEHAVNDEVVAVEIQLRR